MYSDIQRANCGEIANTAGSWVHTGTDRTFSFSSYSSSLPHSSGFEIGIGRYNQSRIRRVSEGL